MENSQKQTAAKTNNIENNKFKVPKTATLLTGWIANSFNGGHNRPIAWKKVMAGEKHFEYGVNLNLKMLTPKTPAYQQLKCTIQAFFVPNSRVWTNAEKYKAQKGGNTEVKITEIPNLGGKILPNIWIDEENSPNKINIQNTTEWRDIFTSSYIPRIAPYEMSGGLEEVALPKISALPLRGIKAIYNDMLRDKSYTEPMIEYKGDTVSEQEWRSYLPESRHDLEALRAKRPTSYYTNYRVDMQGAELEYPPDDMSSDMTLRWLNWENQLAELRAEAMNANANDWDIIAKLGGTRPALEGKVQLLGKKTFTMNYSTVTQNTYNNNESVNDNFRVMGQQGAYSYTNISLPLYNGIEFIEEGYIHVIATVWAETVFEKGIDRNLINVTPFDEYRPDLKEQKLDVIYECEYSGIPYNGYGQVRGFKRKFSEYFKLPNVLAADMLTKNYIESKGLVIKLNDSREPIQVETQKTYQFFEISDQEYYEPYSNTWDFNKDPWKDYTDLLINKNQAVVNKVSNSEDEASTYVTGQNQIFVVGTHYCKAELPIDEEIKNEIMEWGEH